MKRTASAVWSGDLKTGNGTLSTQSGVLKDSRYGFKTRFEDGPGTNPEELIGAAHAGCFSMAMSVGLSEAGFVAERIATTATVTLELVDGNMSISAIHLDCHAKIPGITADAFAKVAEGTKVACIVSRVLNATITLTAVLDA